LRRRLPLWLISLSIVRAVGHIGIRHVLRKAVKLRYGRDLFVISRNAEELGSERSFFNLRHFGSDRRRRILVVLNGHGFLDGIPGLHRATLFEENFVLTSARGRVTGRTRGRGDRREGLASAGDSF